MHYATTKSHTTELHRQDAGKVKGYCGKFAPNPVDPAAASMGLAARTMRTCRKCDEIAEDRRRAELSLADGLFVTEMAASSAPVVAEESLFGAEDLADLYVAPKRRQPRPPTTPDDGGLFGDAELAAAQSEAEQADDEDAPAPLTDADTAGADARDRTVDRADLAAERDRSARVQAQMDRQDARKVVPTLGWSDQVHAGMRAAAAGRGPADAGLSGQRPGGTPLTGAESRRPACRIALQDPRLRSGHPSGRDRSVVYFSRWVGRWQAPNNRKPRTLGAPMANLAEPFVLRYFLTLSPDGLARVWDGATLDLADNATGAGPYETLWLTDGLEHGRRDLLRPEHVAGRRHPRGALAVPIPAVRHRDGAPLRLRPG
ncbi:hypothetical protein GCM10012285_60280 [Streptomyces kronopolitis]|uniref:Uncharacterized protein n=1 Tax=Streptomyces kronopolitis TaxID=1612435 RepID=A0ABQ2K027_9ACTN|nr:hypothetical protein [Streptomyces kronopolitis]GGN61413.1 hypothetical protein GCM10012285_60280 [Streptomyces kronopolitis]